MTGLCFSEEATMQTRSHTPAVILALAAAFAGSPAGAVDYTADFSRMDNLETIRPLVEGCEDFDAMELYRDRMTSSKDLEAMRRTLTAIGLGLFLRCPEGVTGQGIEAVRAQEQPEHPEYSVDFTRIEDFETLRPLVDGCTDFGGLEQLRDKLAATADLNDMRESLVDIGFGVFVDCPAGVTGPGITPSEYRKSGE
jgi:hypothetical protein